MCGRFALNEDPKKFAEHFQISGESDLMASWNIAPSFQIPTITDDQEGRRHLNKMRWGLIPSWAKDAAIGHKLANARGETVAEKPSFRSAFKYHRCLIPASGFYEWKAEKGVKQPWYISLKSGRPMVLAGLWETWHPEDGEAVESCCIITISANSMMKPIHDRMPVILDEDDWSAWLARKEHHADQLFPLIRSHESDSMQAWPVSRELNRVGLRNDAGLIERVTEQT